MRAVFVCMLLLIPSAAADFSLEITERPDGELAPDSGVATFMLQSTVTCEDIMKGTPGEKSTFRFTEPTVEHPDIYVTGSTEATYDPLDCESPFDMLSQDHEFEVRATMKAPGETPIKIQFEAALEVPGPLADRHENKQVSGTISVAYYGTISLRTNTTIASSDGGTIDYKLEVENFANARTYVSFEVVGDPAADVVLPEDVVLDSSNQGGEATKKTVTASVRPVDDEETVTIRAIGSSTKDRDVLTANAPEIHLLARDKGIPAGTPVSMLLGIAAVVLLRRT